MSRLRCLGGLLISTIGLGLNHAHAAEGERPISFIRDVAPILVQRCESCHGAKKSESSYRVDTVASLMEQADYGERQVTAGNLEESLLWRLVNSDDRGERMPLDGDPLPKTELDAIRTWIEQGAKVDVPNPALPLASQLPRAEYTAAPQAYRAAVPITALAIEPESGNVLVSGYRELSIWNTEDGTLLQRMPKITERSAELEYFATPRQLATSGGIPGVYGEVRLLDGSDFSERRLLVKTSDTVLGIAVRPDGQELAAALPDFTLRVYELDSGKERLKIEAHGDRIHSVNWSPDGTQLVSASGDHTTKVFDANTGTLVVNYAGHKSVVFDALFSPEGTHVFSAGGDGKIHYWAVANGARQALLAHADAVHGLQIVGDSLFSMSADRTARQFDWAKRTQVRSYDKHTDWVTALAVDSTRQRLVTGTFNGEVHVWNMQDGSEITRFLAAPGLSKVTVVP